MFFGLFLKNDQIDQSKQRFDTACISKLIVTIFYLEWRRACACLHVNMFACNENTDKLLVACSPSAGLIQSL